MDKNCGTAIRRWRVLWVAAALLLGLPGVSGAVDVALQSQTLFRFMQRDTLTSHNANVLPLYEYLQADFGTLHSHGLALHLYGWGRADLGNSDFYSDDPSGELLYGYLEYTRPFSNFDLRLGRQYVIAGLANDSIDGLSLRTDLGRYFSLQAYGGLPVALDTAAGRSGDSIFGGRLGHHYGSRYEIGVSYQKVSNDSETEDQQVGLDLALVLFPGVNLAGRSSYNLESNGWGENFYEGHVTLGDFYFRPFFEKYSYRDYFAQGQQTPNPFYVLSRGDEAQTDFGSDIFWRKFSPWELGAKVKFYSYDVNQESASYYAGLVTWHGEKLTQVGGELGYMQGDAANNNYLLSRLFFYWDGPAGLPLAFVSGDVLYVVYDKAIYGKDSSFFTSLSAGQKFFSDRLELKLSGDYSSDPDFDSDWRGMLVASYSYGR